MYLKNVKRGKNVGPDITQVQKIISLKYLLNVFKILVN